MTDVAQELVELSDRVLDRVTFLLRADETITPDLLAHSLCLAAGRMAVDYFEPEQTVALLSCMMTSMVAPLGFKVVITDPSEPVIIH